MNKQTNVYCGNCGKYGHPYRRCLAPIISLGVILYKLENNEIKYLLIQRKDTLGFVEFMRGKYNLENMVYINDIFSIMTADEHQKILNNDFDTLWNNLWMNKNLRKFHNEYASSKKKFNILKKGYDNGESIITFQSIIDDCNIKWLSPEWGFPKGRRNIKENDLDCACREFEEETGYKKNQYKVHFDIKPIDELFSGTNNIRYKHIYYIAENLEDVSLKIDINNFSQVSEISNLCWFNFKDALANIRDYNIEKKNVLKKVNEILKKKYVVN